jgi:hypothetical protein
VRVLGTHDYEHADEFGEAGVAKGSSNDAAGFWDGLHLCEAGRVAVGVRDEGKAGVAR